MKNESYCGWTKIGWENLTADEQAEERRLENIEKLNTKPAKSSRPMRGIDGISIGDGSEDDCLGY